jgi:hypothetical protein
VLGCALGCGGAEEGRAVVTFPASAVGREADILRLQLARFQEQHPGIRVELRQTPDASNQRHQLYVQWLNAHASVEVVDGPIRGSAPVWGPDRGRLDARLREVCEEVVGLVRRRLGRVRLSDLTAGTYLNGRATQQVRRHGEWGINTGSGGESEDGP